MTVAGRGEQHAGRHLGADDPGPPRDQGECGERGVLRPFRGDQQDAEHREQDRDELAGVTQDMRQVVVADRVGHRGDGGAGHRDQPDE
jgi:hypothetical protein